MSWVFSPIDARQSGIASKVELPLSRYLKTAWDQGWHDSAFDSISRMVERDLYDEGETMGPEEANRLYGMEGEGGLRFEQPVSRGLAQLMSQRKKQELDRAAILGVGEPGIGRIAMGFGAGMVASLSNPLDFALNFVPVVGSAKYARAASIMGRGTLRQTIARGLITEEALAHVIKYPRFTGAVIEGMVGQMTAEIPLAISNMQDQADYGAEDFLLNVTAGGAFAGVLRAGIDGAARLMRKLTHNTRVRAFRQAIEQATKGEEIDVRSEVELDTKIIEERVKWDPKVKRAEAERYVQTIMPELQAKVRQQYPGEKVVSAAIRTPEGEIFEGAIHFEAYDKYAEKKLGRPIDYSKPLDEETRAALVKNLEDGFVTNTGRFISRDEANKLAGFRDAADIEFRQSGFEFEPDDEMVAEFVKQGMTQRTAEEKMSEVLEQRSRAQQAAEYEKRYWEQPHVKAALESEKQRSIKRYVERERKKFKKVTSAPDIREAEASVKEALPEEKIDETDVSTVEEELQRELDELNALEESMLPEDVHVTIIHGQEFAPGKKTPTVVQVERVNPDPDKRGENIRITDRLEEEGIPVTKEQLATLPSGQYNLKQVFDKLDMLEGEKLAKELDEIKAELADEIKAHKAASDCLLLNG